MWPIAAVLSANKGAYLFTNLNCGGKDEEEQNICLEMYIYILVHVFGTSDKLYTYRED